MPVIPIKPDPPPPAAKSRTPLRPFDLVKKFFQSVGLAAILLAMNYGDLLGGGADVRMHVPFALTGIVAAQMADILILGLLIFVILAPLKRTRVYPFARLLIAVVVPPYILWQLQDLVPFAAQDGFLPFVFVLWIALVLFLYFRRNRWYRRLMRLGDVAGVFLAVFALSSFAQLIWVMNWHPGPYRITAPWSTDPPPYKLATAPDRPPHTPPIGQANAGLPARRHHRIVWVLFDELSYAQIFETRAHDLALPNFDALRAQSTLFTHVRPAGLKTVKIVPSLLTGHTVDDFRFSGHNRFRVHYEDQRGWHFVHGADTIFHDAQRAGYRTAVNGWYNPYCTIYGDALDDCYFMNLDRIDGLMSQTDGFWRNTYSPLQQMVREIKAPNRADKDICTYDVRQRLKTHLDLQQHAQTLLRGDQADFVFLHFGVPHSPNIWSRISDNYTTFCDSSYLDNLALADRMLGRVMAELQASPRWQDTTVIVQGDHSWRIFLWNWLPAWTDEDDAASRPGFDDRPALLVHEPGQAAPRTVADPWPLLKVHGLLEQSLKHETLRF